MQAAAQKWVDSSISKTINCPEDISFEAFKDVYMEAWDTGCKGCTTYRPNDVTGSVLSVSEAADEAPQVDTGADVIYMSEPLDRPQALEGATYKLKWPDSEHAIYLTVNDIIADGRRRPFEVFINSKNMEHFAWTVALTRMISAVFRRGGDVSFVVEELKAVFDPRGGAWVQGKYIPSILAAIGGVLETHMVQIGFLEGEGMGFHRAPELGFQETKTKAKVAELLRGLGLVVHEGAGVVGILRAGTGNRAIGLRADMDALPITETSTHDYPSQTPGVMHACGHDGHMTMLLGAAERLATARDFDGTVVFLFQPNEEHGLGAQAMIAEGVLDRFPIEEIYAIHNLPGAPVGQVSTRAGQICASESLFEITLNGQGGHASMPHVGRDAITIGAEVVLALQSIVARKLAPGAGAVVSVTEFVTDGQRNVLPGRAVLKGDVRARVPEDRLAIRDLMQQLVQGIASAHGISATFTFQTEFIETINAVDPTAAVLRAAQTAGLEKAARMANRCTRAIMISTMRSCQLVQHSGKNW